MAEEQGPTNGQPGAAAAGQATGPQLVVQRIYMKDCSFESPSAPGIFSGEWDPRMDLNIGASSKSLGEDHYEVTLTVTVEAKKDDKVAFLCEIHQAGVFMIRGFNEEDSRRVLNASCPNVIFPYAREAVCDLVTRGGFPQLLLQPVNFDTLYQRHAAEMQQPSAPGQPS
ncbi:MAG: protein-export chaperone SecB [Pseudomonadota bacterium]